jgi:hypothetical protein
MVGFVGSVVPCDQIWCTLVHHVSIQQFESSKSCYLHQHVSRCDHCDGITHSTKWPIYHTGIVVAVSGLCKCSLIFSLGNVCVLYRSYQNYRSILFSGMVPQCGNLYRMYPLVLRSHAARLPIPFLIFGSQVAGQSIPQ